METVTIPKEEYITLIEEVKMLKNTRLYQRLLEFEANIKSKKYTRADLGF